MYYNEFQGKKISALGFGTMRLPLSENGRIDEERTERMFRYALEYGVNYFDTAFPYHGGYSEIVTGKILKKADRESFYLATKYPGHQIAASYHPEEVFERQLQKCGVEYFDFYLLHNVYEKSIDVYNDKRWGIVDYFLRQKEKGRIKHLGFSTHGRPDNIREFVRKYPNLMEFCQIQLNYLDWTLQEGKEKYDFLTEQGIPVWVMEPVRGGRLAALQKSEEEKLRAVRPDWSNPSWAFRFLQGLPNVIVTLSGMSEERQVEENVRTFSERRELDASERELLLQLAEGMKNSLPCTACRYCVDGCPAGLDIPNLIKSYNDIRFGYEGGLTASMQMEALPPEKHPSACIGCGACARVCPQKIDIPKAMQELNASLVHLPKWSEICKKREEEAKALAGKKE